MIEFIRFSDLPGMALYALLFMGVWWLGTWVWEHTGAVLYEWWVMRRADPIEGYDE